MRVLLVHKFFRRAGGAEVILFETARLLSEAGHDVAYLATQHPDNFESPFDDYFVPAWDYSGHGPYQRLRALGTAIYSLSARRSATRLIRDFRPDVAHMMGIFSHLSTSVVDACAAAGVPVLYQCNDYKHICPNFKLYHHGRLCDDCKGGRYYSAVLNRCCHDSLAFSGASMLEAYSEAIRGSLRRRVDVFLFPSRFMAEKTAEFWGSGTFRWRTLRNPFSTPAASEVRSGDYVLSFGRLAEEKGIDQLIRAAALMPDIPVRIVGNGPCEADLRAQAEIAHLTNVEFLGPVWGASLDELLYGARLVVVPSMWHENFPYVVLQSFAAGKPVVGSNRGGIPEMLGDETRGLSYPAEDPEALATAVRRLWSDSALSKAMSEAACAYIRAEFGGDNFMRSLMCAYQTALDPHAPTSLLSDQ